MSGPTSRIGEYVVRLFHLSEEETRATSIGVREPDQPPIGGFDLFRIGITTDA